MISRIAQRLNNHLHVLIVVPLVVILITWPTFPRIFDADEFWLHVVQKDKWLRIWDAWHFERALSGQADLYFSDLTYHPIGQSLAFQAFVFPHALLMVALKTILPVDDAYNLLFLLILCFNAFCGYALINHLIKEKWISLFGAVVFAVATPYPYGSTLPDLTMIGTLPLTMYFFLRSISENQRRLAVLAGVCAGITAFISVYVFAFILMTFCIFVLIKALSLWTQRAFWRDLLIFVVVCGSISFLRFQPMLADRALLTHAAEAYQNRFKSNDALEYFVLKNNPFTGGLFRSALGDSPADRHTGFKQEHKDAYLGYVNLFLLAYAIFRAPRGRGLLPWIVILVAFALLRLGQYLTFNGIEYEHIILPERFLDDWFPMFFRNIGRREYYQIGVVTPLAVLACYGLAALLRTRSAKARILIALLSALVVLIEFTVPLFGQTLERDKTAYIAWLRSEPNEPIKLINLPHADGTPHYFLYLQTLTGLPHAYGQSSRLGRNVGAYYEGNLILRTWRRSRSIYCLSLNRLSFTTALEQLLADGFTHIVLHKWLYGDQFIIQSFRNIPPVYDDGQVSIYRVSDLRLSCQNQAAQLPRFIHFAQSASGAPGRQSAILSIHPDQPIDHELFDYLDALFSDWRSLLHIYQDTGELAMQNAGKLYPNLDAFIQDNQVIHVLYNTRDADTDLLKSHLNFGGFNLCQREASDDGAVIEHFVNREYSCELVISGNPFEVRYENGARLDNLQVQVDADIVDLQLRWSNLPDEAYSASLQVFDASGEKFLGQDSVIGYETLGRYQVDLSSLPPGDYVVKLIMYDFNSGAIVPGTVSADGARFERYLKVADIHRT